MFFWRLVIFSFLRAHMDWQRASTMFGSDDLTRLSTDDNASFLVRHSSRLHKSLEETAEANRQRERMPGVDVWSSPGTWKHVVLGDGAWVVVPISYVTSLRDCVQSHIASVILLPHEDVVAPGVD